MLKKLHLNKIFIFLLILFNYSLQANEKEEILFTLEKTLFTTIDLDQRINYLNLFENSKDNKIEKKYYINDLVSVALFDVFSKKENLNLSKSIVEKYYLNIIQSYERRNGIQFKSSELSKLINEEIIKKNIKYDLQRKQILEILFKESNYKTKSDNYNVLDIYNINFDYFIIPNKFLKKLNIEDNKINFTNSENLKKYLNGLNIDYEFYNKKIINLEKINQKVKKNILENNNEFLIYENEYFLLGKINKIIKKNINLKYTFYQINNDKIEGLYDIINCKNIDQVGENYSLDINKFDKIDISKLNIKVIKNLISINDKIKISNNENEYILILCDIEYDDLLAKNLIKQNKIDSIANSIEKDFIADNKIKFSFIQYFND